MHSPRDPEYALTKEIKRGNTKMNEDFLPLAEWIMQEYGPLPLNIIYDVIEREGGQPKLLIIFEREEEYGFFYSKSSYMYNKNKQKAIGKAYLAMLRENSLESKYLAQKPFVIFAAFEGVARIEAKESVSREQVEKLTQEIGYEGLWLIHFASGGFFVYTDQQVHECVLNGQKELWTDKSFKLLKKYDEFDYFSRDTFAIHIDSKENLDNNYGGNWYYYYK